MPGKIFPLMLLIGGFLSSHSLNAQVAFWQYYMGGSAYDKGRELLYQPDGTLVIGGEVKSVNGLGKGNHSSDYDLVVFKYSTQGKRFWKVMLGGTGTERMGEMINTRDGGFLIVGTSESTDGDVSGNRGGSDIWVVKLNGLGKISWTRRYGGRGDDMGTAALQLQDGSYLIGGESGSINHSKNPEVRHHGGLDSWIARISPKGELIWERLIGGTTNEQVRRLHQAPNGQIIAIHSSDSQDGDVLSNLGKKDVWVHSLDPESGEIGWQNVYGGSDNDDIHASAMDSTGRLILGGTTFSQDGQISTQRGLGDCWLLALSPKGDVQWSQTYGGRRPEGINDLVLTQDGGIAFCGLTKSRTGEGDIVLNHGYYDGWLVKTDGQGDHIWSRTIGYEGKDVLESMIQEPDGGFLTVGYAVQDPAGIPLPAHGGMADLWLANFDNLNRNNVRPFVTPPVLFGKVVDKETDETLPASITLTDNETLDSLSSARTEPETGEFALLLPAYGLVSINILSKGYMFYGRDIRMDTVSDKSSTQQVYELEKIQVGSTLILKNIYFQTGRWDLLRPSYAELERVIAFLELNPRVRIEISGHTDNTGNPADKQELSLNRAVAVKDYLLANGIAAYRLKVKGFGMSRPIATNKTAVGRRRNRRVQFKVTQM